MNKNNPILTLYLLAFSTFRKNWFTIGVWPWLSEWIVPSFSSSGRRIIFTVMDQRIEKQQQRTSKKNFKTTAALEYLTYFNILPLLKKNAFLYHQMPNFKIQKCVSDQLGPLCHCGYHDGEGSTVGLQDTPSSKPYLTVVSICITYMIQHNFKPFWFGKQITLWHKHNEAPATAATGFSLRSGTLSESL